MSLDAGRSHHRDVTPPSVTDEEGDPDLRRLRTRIRELDGDLVVERQRTELERQRADRLHAWLMVIVRKTSGMARDYARQCLSSTVWPDGARRPSISLSRPEEETDET